MSVLIVIGYLLLLTVCAAQQGDNTDTPSTPIPTKSIVECLLELNLTFFSSQLSTELTEKLENAESSENFTIFALNNTLPEEVEAPDSLLGHIADGKFKVEDEKIGRKALPTLAEEIYLHIERISNITANPAQKVENLST